MCCDEKSCETCKCQWGLTGLFVGGFIIIAACIFAAVPLFLSIPDQKSWPETYYWYWILVYLWMGLGVGMFVLGFMYEFCSELKYCCEKFYNCCKVSCTSNVKAREVEEVPAPYVMI